MMMSCLNGSFVLPEEQAIRSSVIEVMGEKLERTTFEANCFAFRYQDYRPKVVTSSMLQQAQVANERFLLYWPDHAPYSSPDPLVDKHFRSKSITVWLTAYHKNSGNSSIAVFGNSFAHRSFRAIVDAFGQRIKEIRLIANPGCPPFIGSIFTEIPEVECDSVLNASVELIEEMKPDIIFIIFRLFNGAIVTQLTVIKILIFLSRPSHPINSPIVDLSKDDQLNNIQHTIDRISAVTKRIILEYPLPVNIHRWLFFF
uniref:SGNH domain-containing protein n=1 Tax=Parascaris equorum TaxID=6256 RepID=A0A914RIM6_PAREQ